MRRGAFSGVVLVLFMVDKTELEIVLVMVYASPRVKVFSIISLLVDMTSTLAWWSDAEIMLTISPTGSTLGMVT
jgi:hypothetical protein